MNGGLDLGNWVRATVVSENFPYVGDLCEERLKSPVPSCQSRRHCREHRHLGLELFGCVARSVTDAGNDDSNTGVSADK